MLEPSSHRQRHTVLDVSCRVRLSSYENFRHTYVFLKSKVKGVYSSLWETHLRATGRHLPYGMTRCCLPPDTSERAPPQPQAARPVLDDNFAYPEGS